MKYGVYLDSTQATGPRPSNSTYNLNQSVIGMQSLTVKSFMFANTLYNISSSNKQLNFDSTLLTIPEAFYTFSQLIKYIDDALMNSIAFTSNLTTEMHAVVLNADNSLTWTIGNNILLKTSTMYDNFLLNQYITYTGNFLSSLFLAQPLAIALQSNALQGSAMRFVTSANISITQPFWIVPVTSGSGEMQDPAYDLDIQIQCSNINLSQFDVLLYNPSDNRELKEINHWCMILEITTR